MTQPVWKKRSWVILAVLVMLAVGCQKDGPPKDQPQTEAKKGAAPAAENASPEAPGKSLPGESATTSAVPVAPCVPACEGKSCGEDGCGGSCGECGADATCAEGQCQCNQPLCLGECCTAGASCVAYGCCVPDCNSKSCGSDGCGGSCGKCDSGTPCQSGKCATQENLAWPVDLQTVKVAASSSCPSRTEEYYGYERSITYGPDNVFDGHLDTAWIECAKGPGIGQWLEIDLGSELMLTGLDLYIGYQRVENDEHGDRYPLNTRPKKIKIQTKGQDLSLPLADKRDAQHIALDGSPTQTIKITVEDAYVGKDADCSFSEIVIFGKPTDSQLEAYANSVLKPGMTLVYRDIGMDASEFDSPDPEDVLYAAGQGYTSIRLAPVASDTRGFVIVESEEAAETMSDLQGFFWEAGQTFAWNGGGVQLAGTTGPAIFPATSLAPDTSGRKLHTSLEGTDEVLIINNDSPEPGDQQYDALLNSRYGYVHTDGSGFSGVAASGEVTIVDTYPTDAEPDAEREASATKRLTGRLGDWKKARLIADGTALTTFYANAADAAKPHAPGMAIEYQETATHIGPTRAFTAFQEMVTTPKGKVYAMRELEWTVVLGEFKVAAERVVYEKSFPLSDEELAAAAKEAKPGQGVAQELPAPPALMTPDELKRELVKGDVGKAKKLNTKGFRARKGSDNAGALEAYRQAVEVAPSYGRAKLNYACELSLAGRLDEALAQLTWLYRTGRDEDLDLLAAATSDQDLRALWPLPAFRALVEGVVTRRPYDSKSVLEGGCFGYSPTTGAVACGYVSETSEWAPVAGGVIFAAKAEEFQLKSDEEEMDSFDEMNSAARKARIASVKLPHFKLQQGKDTPLGETGYRATWRSSEDEGTVTITSASGATGTLALTNESLANCGQPVPYNNPTEVVIWLVPGWERFVVEAISRYEAAYEDGEMVQGAELLSAVGLIDLGSR